MERRGVELVGRVEPLQEEQIQVQEAKVQQSQAYTGGQAVQRQEARKKEMLGQK